MGTEGAVGNDSQLGDGKCSFYLQKKKRKCNFDAKPGTAFCGNHMPGGNRIPCPVNPNHTILEKDLEAHVSRCPDRLRMEHHKTQPFFTEGLNEGEGQGVQIHGGQGDSWGLAQRRSTYAARMGQEHLVSLVNKVTKVWESACSTSLPERILEPEECKPFMAIDHQGNRPFSEKHAKQQASIVGNMQLEGMVTLFPEAAIVEFGAGRGYLSNMIADATPANRVVLVDRAPFRFKADRALRKHADFHVERVKCDIKDFNPLGVDALQSSKPQQLGVPQDATTCEASSLGKEELKSLQPWLAVGKHLCGAATDFTLRCCLGHMSPPQGSCQAIAIATCCHHRCTWKDYTGKEFFSDNSFTPLEFELVSWMTGWALCGHTLPAGEGSEDVRDNQEGHAKQLKQSVDSNSEPKWGDDGRLQPDGGDASKDCGHSHPSQWWPRAERMVIGQRCKRLIDHGRLQWLSSHGLQANLVTYIPGEISGENKLLLAKFR